MRLLTRVFSLIQMTPEMRRIKLQIREQSLDFDLAMFANYSHSLKLNLNFVFQTILFRLFRSNRMSKILGEDFQSTVAQVAFRR